MAEDFTFSRNGTGADFHHDKKTFLHLDTVTDGEAQEITAAIQAIFVEGVAIGAMDHTRTGDILQAAAARDAAVKRDA